MLLTLIHTPSLERDTTGLLASNKFLILDCVHASMRTLMAYSPGLAGPIIDSFSEIRDILFQVHPSLGKLLRNYQAFRVPG